MTHDTSHYTSKGDTRQGYIAQAREVGSKATHTGGGAGNQGSREGSVGKAEAEYCHLTSNIKHEMAQGRCTLRTQRGRRKARR